MDEQDYKAMNEESKPKLKQTAVDYLAERYNYITWMRNRDEISAGTADEWRTKFLRVAKQMEKEQMFEYIKNLYCNGDSSLKFHSEEFEQYYNKTYI